MILIPQTDLYQHKFLQGRKMISEKLERNNEIGDEQILKAKRMTSIAKAQHHPHFRLDLYSLTNSIYDYGITN